MTDPQSASLAKLPVPLERDVFLRTLIRHLSGQLQDLIGLEEASGFISLVGQQMGEELNTMYRQSLDTEALKPEQVAQVLVDLKQRIQGDFWLESIDAEKMVLKTHSCPFGDKVKDRPSLCMMTSNVFGTIASSNLGYAKVDLVETIAQGATGCTVVVYLDDLARGASAKAIEYFGPTA